MKAIYINRGSSEKIIINKIEIGLEYSHSTNKGIWFRDCGTGRYFIAYQ